MPLTAWLGWTQFPGEVPGYGPLDADDSRTIAGLLAQGPGSQWCVTLTDPAGHPVADACARHGPPGPPGRRPPASPGHEPARGGPSPKDPATANLGRQKGPTQAAAPDHGPTCRPARAPAGQAPQPRRPCRTQPAQRRHQSLAKPRQPQPARPRYYPDPGLAARPDLRHPADRVLHPRAGIPWLPAQPLAAPPHPGSQPHLHRPRLPPARHPLRPRPRHPLPPRRENVRTQHPPHQQVITTQVGLSLVLSYAPTFGSIPPQT